MESHSTANTTPLSRDSARHSRSGGSVSKKRYARLADEREFEPVAIPRIGWRWSGIGVPSLAVLLLLLVGGGSVALSAAARQAGPTPVVSADTSGGGSGPGWYFAVIVVLTLINGAFSMAETALVSVRRSRVDQLIEEGRRGARMVLRLVQNPPRFIATTQVGITILGFASAAAAATTLADPVVAPVRALLPRVSASAAHTIAVAVITLLVSLMTMVLGEIGPKSLAVQAPDVWALRLAPFVNFCAILFAPLTYLVVGLSGVLVRPFGAKARFETPYITREEFEHMISTGEKHGELDEGETTIIKNVFDLSETPVRSVMTPRIYMTMLSLDATLEQTLELILDSGHSRIPAYDKSVDDIVGIVNAKDLLPLFRENKHDVDLRLVMREPFFVPLTKSVKDLLEEFRRSNQQLAIVQDEYGGTAGLVTIEDLLEEIVGDIRDEYDVDEPEMVVISPTESIIDGRLGIDDVNDRLGTELPHDEYDTVGGLVFGELGHNPVAGDQIVLEGIAFTVESVDGRRIRSLRAIQVRPGAAERDAAPLEATAPRG